MAGHPIDKINHAAVIGDYDVVFGKSGCLGNPSISAQVAHFAVDWHHIFWLDGVVAVQQFTLGCVARDVNVRVALVNDMRAEFHQAVDHSSDGIFVARNKRGGQDDQVIFLDGDLAVFIVVHA